MVLNVPVNERFASFLTDWDYEEYLLFGGYGSGKSYHIALKIIIKLLEEKRTCLVCRAVFEDIKESCYRLFETILKKLDMLSDAKRMADRYKGGRCYMSVSPMEIRFANGSRIIFRGVNDYGRMKSLEGVSVVWIEECSEIRYNAYLELLGRVREPGITKHFILSCNPVGKENWVYQHYFVRTDNDGKEHMIQDENEIYRRRTVVNKNNGVYYHHSIPDDNTFLDGSYIRRLNRYKTVDPHLWVVARWGRFGTAGTRVLPNFVVATNANDFKQRVRSVSSRFHFFGLDFGFEDSFNALISCCVDDKNKILYIYDEVYVNHITDDRFANRHDVRKVAKRTTNCGKPIVADSEEPKTIKYYRQQGFNMRKSFKFPGSRLQYTKKMKRFHKIVCSPKCKNTIRELKDLTYAKDSRGVVIYDEFNIDPHTFSALWYALDTYEVSDIKEYETNSRSG